MGILSKVLPIFKDSQAYTARLEAMQRMVDQVLAEKDARLLKEQQLKDERDSYKRSSMEWEA
jgi:hypothetical protein